MAEKEEGIVAEYAGFWVRVAAFLIDAVVLWVIGAFLLAVIALITLPMSVAQGFTPFHPVWYFYRGAWSLLWIVVPAAYFVFLWALRAQTLGMMALRIRLIRADGSKVDWGAAVVRFVGYIICGLTLGLLFLWVAFDRRKQGLHDKMAYTYVIMHPRRREALPEAELSQVTGRFTIGNGATSGDD